MKRTASAVWMGNIQSGKGTLSTQSGVMNQTPYSFKTRFESEQGTNPEELIAAAHAGCFTMAFSLFLEKAGYTATQLNTTATLLLEKDPGAETQSIQAIHLEVVGKVPGIVPHIFAEVAANAKTNCIVSRVLNAKITLDAKLES